MFHQNTKLAIQGLKSKDIRHDLSAIFEHAVVISQDYDNPFNLSELIKNFIGFALSD